MHCQTKAAERPAAEDEAVKLVESAYEYGTLRAFGGADLVRDGPFDDFLAHVIHWAQPGNNQQYLTCLSFALL